MGWQPHRASIETPGSHWKGPGRADLDPAVLARVLTLLDKHGWPVVSFTDRDTEGLDFIVAQEGSGRAPFDEFVSVTLPYALLSECPRVPDPSWLPVRESGQTLEENWLFRLRRERFRSRASGVEHDFYVLHLADSVNVVALTTDRQLVLVRQFRAGSQHDSLETPGGLSGAGEDPLIAGARELLEETGYAGDPPRLLGTVWANPSIMTARSTTILVTNVRRVADIALDHGEEVGVELVPADEIPQMLREGRIDHALAVLGLLWWLAAELSGPKDLPGR